MGVRRELYSEKLPRCRTAGVPSRGTSRQRERLLSAAERCQSRNRGKAGAKADIRIVDVCRYERESLGASTLRQSYVGKADRGACMTSIAGDNPLESRLRVGCVAGSQIGVGRFDLGIGARIQRRDAGQLDARFSCPPPGGENRRPRPENSRIATVTGSLAGDRFELAGKASGINE
jgi:hypothetical protein